MLQDQHDRGTTLPGRVLNPRAETPIAERNVHPFVTQLGPRDG